MERLRRSGEHQRGHTRAYRFGVGIVVEKGKWPALPRDYATLSETEKAEVVAQAKSLLYVAMTRAMSHVLLTGAGPAPDELPPA